MKKSTWMSVGYALGVALVATVSTKAFADENEYTDLNFPIEIDGIEANINISLKNEFHSYPDFVRVRYEVIDGEFYGAYSLLNENSLDTSYLTNIYYLKRDDSVSMGSDVGSLEITFKNSCEEKYTSTAESDLSVRCIQPLGGSGNQTFTYSSLQDNSDISSLRCALESYRGAHVGRFLNASEDDPNSESLGVKCHIEFFNGHYLHFEGFKDATIHYGKERRNQYLRFTHYGLETYRVTASFVQPGSDRHNTDRGMTTEEYEEFMEEFMESLPDTERILETF